MKTQLSTRTCPNCNQEEFDTALDLSINDFVSLNPTYNHDAIPGMGFADDQRFPIVNCHSCEFVYALYCLDDELTQYLYTQVCDTEKVHTYKDQQFYKIQRRVLMVHLLMSLSGNNNHPKFMDYGCGWGEVLNLAKAAMADCYGLEIGQHQVEYLKQQGLPIAQNISELAAWGPFDVVFCNQVLEHVPNPAQVIAGIASTVKPGGYGYFAVPDFSEQRMAEIVTSYKLKGDILTKNVNPWEHLNYFSSTTFRHMLEANGFRVVAPAGALTRSVLIDNGLAVLKQLKALFNAARPVLLGRGQFGTSLIVRRE